MSDELPQESVRAVIERIDRRTERIEKAMFYGDGEQPPVLSRLATLEERTGKVERAAPRAGVWGAAGMVLGGLVISVLSYFGVKPQQ